MGISLQTSELLGRKQAIVVLVLKCRRVDYARGTTAEIAEMSAATRAIALHATRPAAGQPADNGPHSIEAPSANSTLCARRPADLTSITQLAAHIDAQVEFLQTHTRARLVSDSVPLQVW